MAQRIDDLDAAIIAARNSLLFNTAFGREDPSQPTAPPPGTGAFRTVTGEAVGGDSAEMVRVLHSIRDLMREWYRSSARGGDSGEEQPDARGPGLLDALRPLTDRILQRTALGRAGSNFYRRVQPFAKPFTDRIRRAGARQIQKRLGRSLTGGVRRAAANPPPTGNLFGTGGGGAKPPAGGTGSGAAAAGARGAAGAGARGAGAAAGGEAAGAAAGAEAAGAGALGAAGVIALPIAAMVAAGFALQEVNTAGRQLAQEQEQHARQLAEYSAATAAATFALDAERQFRAVARGDQTAESAGAMLRAIDRWERATQPWEIAGERLKNALAGGFMDAITKLLSLFEPFADNFSRFLDDWLGQEDSTQGQLFGDFLRNTAAEEDAKARRREEAMRRLREHHDRG